MGSLDRLGAVYCSCSVSWGAVHAFQDTWAGIPGAVNQQDYLGQGAEHFKTAWAIISSGPSPTGRSGESISELHRRKPLQDKVVWPQVENESAVQEQQLHLSLRGRGGHLLMWPECQLS